MSLELNGPACQIFPPTDTHQAWATFRSQTQRSARSQCVESWCFAQPQPCFAPSTWVRLLCPPTAFSFDQAWLLCECENDRWLAWVPDYGEILLSPNEFCAIDEGI